jgi:hypothetical protein
MLGRMHLVVAVRVPASPEAAASALVKILGLSLYEARSRLAGDPPRILSVQATSEAAMEQVAALHQAGFVAMAIAGEQIDHDRGRAPLASLAFEPESLIATLRDGSTREVRYDEIALFLRGVRSSQHTSTREETTSKFSPGKAVLTGGLLLRSKTTTTTTSTATTRQSFLYIHDQSGAPPLALYEQRISYAFLGAAIQPSSLANFLHVVGLLRQRAPRARYDERLLRPLPLGAMPLPPTGFDPEEWKIDVAASVLALSALALG